ncbi:MAG: choice-of-anchor P family protein [Thermoplasmatota archaeon]
MHQSGGRRSVGLAILLAVASVPLVTLMPFVGTGRAATGSLVGTLTFGQNCGSGIGTGISFDGVNLWYSCYQSNPDLFRANPRTGAITGSWDIAGGLGSIAYDAGRHVLWAGPGSGNFSNAVVEIPLDASFSVSGPYGGGFPVTEAASGGCPGLDDGIAIDGLANILYVSYDCSTHIYKYDASSGAYLGNFMWTGTSCYNSGLAIGGQDLYQGSDGCSHVWVIDKTTLAAQFNFSTAVSGDPNFRDEGLTCDTQTFGVPVMWSKEAYSPARAAAFQIPANTCGSGGLPPCTPLANATIADPEVGFDYYNGGKFAQSPLQPLPTMSGPVTLTATTSDPSATAEVQFFVDGTHVGTATTAPYSVSWNASSVPIGEHNATAIAYDTNSCPSDAVQPFRVTCGAPIDVAIARPAPGNIYSYDVELPGGTTPPTVLGNVTVQGFASDPTRIAWVNWSADGGPAFASRVTGSPWSALWASGQLTPGDHTVQATFVQTNAACQDAARLVVRIVSLSLESRSRALFATTLQPTQPQLQSEGTAYPSSPDSTFRRESVPQIGFNAEALTDASREPTTTTAFSTSEVTNVSLDGGLIVATVLHAAAEASFDPMRFAFHTNSSGTVIAGLRIAGVPVSISQPNTRVDVPGVGYVVLDEQVANTSAYHTELRVDALHLFSNVHGLRSEVILGQAVAGADINGTPFAGRAHNVDVDDDAGTGHDVGGTYATGLVIPVGTVGDNGTYVLGGRVGGNDRADVYKFFVAQGEKLEVTARPSEQAFVTTHTMPDPPAVGGATVDRAAMPNMDMWLLDPDHQSAILESNAPFSLPQRIELNVNETGYWAIQLSADQDTNYTLSVTVVPIVLAPKAPSGAACGDPASPLLSSPIGTVSNTMVSNDVVQEYQLHAAIGDNIVVTMAMPDLDGQDFDLTLYDASCHVLSQSKLGHWILWPGDQPKGEPEAVIQVPALYTGTYYVEASRFVGVGNYVITAYEGTVIPTLPMNDAFTGAPASHNCSAPTPLPFPDGVFEGRFEDGDRLDCYSFAIAAGDAVSVSLLPSPANSVEMTVTGGGGTIAQQDVLGHGAVVLMNPSKTAQTVVLGFTPTVGGGNYVFTVLHAGGT